MFETFRRRGWRERSSSSISSRGDRSRSIPERPCEVSKKPTFSGLLTRVASFNHSTTQALEAGLDILPRLSVWDLDHIFCQRDVELARKRGMVWD